MVPEGHSNSLDLGKLKGLLAALSDFTSCWKLWAPHLHQRLAGEKLVKLCSGAASSRGGVGERVPSLSAAFGVWWGLQGCGVRRLGGVKGGGVRSGHAHSHLPERLLPLCREAGYEPWGACCLGWTSRAVSGSCRLLWPPEELADINAHRLLNHEGWTGLRARVQQPFPHHGRGMKLRGGRPAPDPGLANRRAGAGTQLLWFLSLTAPGIRSALHSVP